MKRVCGRLTKALGGNLNEVQKMLIDRAAMLSLRIDLMDKQALRDGVMSEKNGREYLAWTNSLTRLMRQLGVSIPKDAENPDRWRLPAFPTASPGQEAGQDAAA
jgi:hypothetical protein